MLKRTPLFEEHQKAGGRLIEFGGWEMPVQYSGIVDEHLTVRRAAGVFDISHMGQVRLSGEGALRFLNGLLTNDLRKIRPGQGQYTLLCNEMGGVIDDLYVYQTGPDEYILVVNASRSDVDLEWIRKNLGDAATTLEDLRQSHGALAVQGPRVKEFIDQCFEPGATGRAPTLLAKNELTEARFESSQLWVARTGYTGEDGFEVLAPADRLADLWGRLMEIGRGSGLKPAGLGARDTLRTEVCFPLYGHELDEQTSPLEAGLGRFVDFNKGGFVGRDSMEKQKTVGLPRKLIAFKMVDKSAPPRPHYPIWNQGDPEEKIGEVTSGTQSPSLQQGVGMGYVATSSGGAETPIRIEIRGQKFGGRIVPKPIYRKPESKP